MLKRTIILIVLVASLLGFTFLKNNQESLKPAELRWQKLDSLGQNLSSWKGPWSCVEDKKTGLIWEVKSDNESIHDGYWTYSWFNGRFGAENMGDCYFESQRCDTQDLVRRINRQRLCGYSNWRLPTTEELMTLATKPTKTGAPHIRNDYFPHTKSGDYWTSDGQQALTGTFKHLGYGAKAVNFTNGKPVTIPYRNAAFLRLVTKKSY
jgi:hypothetical protein